MFRHDHMLQLAHGRLGLFLLPPAAAKIPAGNDAVFRYRGADRDSRRVQRAKQEGSVSLYTSLAPTESQPLAAAFERKYGVRVVLWRALSGQGVGRGGPEAAAPGHAGGG